MTTDSTRPTEDLWDANDVARYLKASRSWVYHQAEAGKLPHLRIGALLRFDPGRIKAFAHGEPGRRARVVTMRPKTETKAIAATEEEKE